MQTAIKSSSGTLDAVDPFDFQRSLDFLQGFGPTMEEQHVAAGSLTKAVMVDGHTVIYRVTSGGNRNSGRPHVDYELFSAEGPALPASITEAVRAHISFFLSLDDDLRPFYSIAKQRDPGFYPIIEKLWGLHHVKFPTLLEICCWAIIVQRVQRSIALRTKRGLVEKYGGSLELDGTNCTGRSPTIRA